MTGVCNAWCFDGAVSEDHKEVVSQVLMEVLMLLQDQQQSHDMASPSSLKDAEPKAVAASPSKYSSSPARSVLNKCARGTEN